MYMSESNLEKIGKKKEIKRYRSEYILNMMFNFFNKSIITNQKKGKLHFTTLNYILNCTLHPKILECTLCTLNYHILHPHITFTVKLNRN